jgi:hypothetical protein
LAGNAEGSIQWLIIPGRSAAPQTAVYYDIGGVFSYKINGVYFEVPLWPASINVVPDPSLNVRYFWQQVVFGLDPFAPDFSLPPVPFVVGVLIFNDGFGTAFNMRMSSAQPKIVDNVKGLLVSFALIGSQGNGCERDMKQLLESS